MSQDDLTRREFTLQAERLAASPTFTSLELRDRLAAGLGEARSGRLLDMACGPGIVCEALAAEAKAVVGVDLTPEMVERARRRCEEAGHANTSFREASALALPFEDASFDAVVTRLAVHHFEDPARALSEAARVLRAGGRLVVLDIVSSEDAAEAELHNAFERLRDPSHVRMLPETELCAAVEAAGFEIAELQAWEQQRRFGEWASIVEDARSLEAVEPVMRNLALGGRSAGVDLRVEGDEVCFVHHWRALAADRRSPE